MRRNRLKVWVSALAVLTLILWAGLASAAMPKNVILMISDGQGYNTVKATNYWTGTSSVYESFPYQFGCSTFSAGKAGPPPILAIGYDPVQAWANLLVGYANQTDPQRGRYVDTTEIFKVMIGTGAGNTQTHLHLILD